MRIVMRCIREIRDELVDAYHKEMFVKVLAYLVLSLLGIGLTLTIIRSVNGYAPAWSEFFYGVGTVLTAAVVLFAIIVSFNVSEEMSNPKNVGPPAPIPVITIQDLDNASNDFMDSIDRSILGRFAIPDTELLRLLDMVQRSNIIGRLESVSYDYLIDGLYARLSQFNLEREDVRDELFFWWKNGDDEVLKEYVNKRRANDPSYQGLSERLNQFDAISTHQDKHDYFEAGVWDIALIERCIADDIDPSLALTLAVHNV